MAGRSLAAAVLLAVCLLGTVIPRAHSKVGPVGTQCEPTGDGKPSCVCKHPKGIIDLTPIAAQGSPKFTGVAGPQFLYDYNPCYAFNDVDPCSNAYVCQSSTDGQNHYKIADTGTEQIYIDDTEGIYVYYTAPTDTTDIRETMVKLVCDQGYSEGTANITTTGDSEVTLLYRFTLTSCHGCPGGCGQNKNIIGYVGIIVIVILALALVLYFIIGAVILKVRFQKTGSDMIPNKGFWFALPVLIKDGFKFTFSPCVKAVKKDKYQEM